MKKTVTLDDYFKHVGNNYFYHRFYLLVFALAFLGFSFARLLALQGLYPIVHKHESFVLVGALILAAFVFRFFTTRRHLAYNIARVECPECSEYIPLDSWLCACESPVDRSIFLGCPNCGTKYGGSENDVRSLTCKNCDHNLWFDDEYKIEKWSVLGKGESYEKDRIMRTRSNPILRHLSTMFLILGFIGAALVMINTYRGYSPVPPVFYIKEIPFKGYEEGLPVFVEFLTVLVGFGGSAMFDIIARLTRSTPYVLVKNPKYRSEDGEEETEKEEGNCS